MRFPTERVSFWDIIHAPEDFVRCLDVRPLQCVVNEVGLCQVLWQCERSMNVFDPRILFMTFARSFGCFFEFAMADRVSYDGPAKLDRIEVETNLYPPRMGTLSFPASIGLDSMITGGFKSWPMPNPCNCCGEANFVPAWTPLLKTSGRYIPVCVQCHFIYGCTPLLPPHSWTPLHGHQCSRCEYLSRTKVDACLSIFDDVTAYPQHVQALWTCESVRVRWQTLCKTIMEITFAVAMGWRADDQWAVIPIPNPHVKAHWMSEFTHVVSQTMGDRSRLEMTHWLTPWCRVRMSDPIDMVRLQGGNHPQMCLLLGWITKTLERTPLMRFDEQNIQDFLATGHHGQKLWKEFYPCDLSHPETHHIAMTAASDMPWESRNDFLRVCQDAVHAFMVHGGGPTEAGDAELLASAIWHSTSSASALMCTVVSGALQPDGNPVNYAKNMKDSLQSQLAYVVDVVASLLRFDPDNPNKKSVCSWGSNCQYWTFHMFMCSLFTLIESCPGCSLFSRVWDECRCDACSEMLDVDTNGIQIRARTLLTLLSMRSWGKDAGDMAEVVAGIFLMSQYQLFLKVDTDPDSRRKILRCGYLLVKFLITLQAWGDAQSYKPYHTKAPDASEIDPLLEAIPSRPAPAPEPVQREPASAVPLPGPTLPTVPVVERMPDDAPVVNEGWGDAQEDWETCTQPGGWGGDMQEQWSAYHADTADKRERDVGWSFVDAQPDPKRTCPDPRLQPDVYMGEEVDPQIRLPLIPVPLGGDLVSCNPHPEIREDIGLPNIRTVHIIFSSEIDPWPCNNEDARWVGVVILEALSQKIVVHGINEQPLTVMLPMVRMEEQDSGRTLLAAARCAKEFYGLELREMRNDSMGHFVPLQDTVFVGRGKCVRWYIFVLTSKMPTPGFPDPCQRRIQGVHDLRYPRAYLAEDLWFSMLHFSQTLPVRRHFDWVILAPVAELWPNFFPSGGASFLRGRTLNCVFAPQCIQYLIRIALNVESLVDMEQQSIVRGLTRVAFPMEFVGAQHLGSSAPECTSVQEIGFFTQRYFMSWEACLPKQSRNVDPFLLVRDLSLPTQQLRTVDGNDVTAHKWLSICDGPFPAVVGLYRSFRESQEHREVKVLMAAQRHSIPCDPVMRAALPGSFSGAMIAPLHTDFTLTQVDQYQEGPDFVFVTNEEDPYELPAFGFNQAGVPPVPDPAPTPAPSRHASASAGGQAGGAEVEPECNRTRDAAPVPEEAADGSAHKGTRQGVQDRTLDSIRSPFRVPDDHDPRLTWRKVNSGYMAGAYQDYAGRSEEVNCVMTSSYLTCRESPIPFEGSTFRICPRQQFGAFCENEVCYTHHAHFGQGGLLFIPTAEMKKRLFSLRRDVHTFNHPSLQVYMFLILCSNSLNKRNEIMSAMGSQLRNEFQQAWASIYRSLFYQRQGVDDSHLSDHQLPPHPEDGSPDQVQSRWVLDTQITKWCESDEKVRASMRIDERPECTLAVGVDARAKAQAKRAREKGKAKGKGGFVRPWQ